jgi:acyl carrier protein
LNELRPSDNAVPKALEAVLLGDGALLDSMDFVNFVVAVEDQLSETLGVSISITQELNSIGDSSTKPTTLGHFVEFLSARVSPKQ